MFFWGVSFWIVDDYFLSGLTYPRQVVFQIDSSQSNMLQFVNLLLQPVIKFLHHHQAFIRSDATLGSHPASGKHAR